MQRVFLGLGGNIGDLTANFIEAKRQIKEKCGKITRESSVYQTPPLGFESENKFLNQVIEIETDLIPEQIFEIIIEIEKKSGRIRTTDGYESRTMDIDILFYDNLIINDNNLVIPHPRIAERRFVLVPLAEIAPDFVHPLSGKTSFQMLQDCPDASQIVKTDLAP